MLEGGEDEDNDPASHQQKVISDIQMQISAK